VYFVLCSRYFVFHSFLSYVSQFAFLLCVPQFVCVACLNLCVCAFVRLCVCAFVRLYVFVHWIEFAVRGWPFA
jgi:hypothetical protein